MPTFDVVELIKLIIYGVVEGITEWLPVSSTGHLLLLEEFLPLQMSERFLALFRVVIQLAAVWAVLIYFRHELWPFRYRKISTATGGEKMRLEAEQNILSLWYKILLACLPAAVLGLPFDEIFERYFYNPLSVSLALILVALLFLGVEYWRKDKAVLYRETADITWQIAFLIGICQAVAAIFPGVSRSGACILGALALGVSRDAAARFSFYLAIPVMCGASFLKLLRLREWPTSTEVLSLLVACSVAFLTSLISIRFLLAYVRKHNFTVFAIYRILLGLTVLAIFAFL